MFHQRPSQCDLTRNFSTIWKSEEAAAAQAVEEDGRLVPPARAAVEARAAVGRGIQALQGKRSTIPTACSTLANPSSQNDFQFLIRSLSLLRRGPLLRRRRHLLLPRRFTYPLRRNPPLRAGRRRPRRSRHLPRPVALRRLLVQLQQPLLLPQPDQQHRQCRKPKRHPPRDLPVRDVLRLRVRRQWQLHLPRRSRRRRQLRQLEQDPHQRLKRQWHEDAGPQRHLAQWDRYLCVRCGVQRGAERD